MLYGCDDDGGLTGIQVTQNQRTVYHGDSTIVAMLRQEFVIRYVVSDGNSLSVEGLNVHVAGGDVEADVTQFAPDSVEVSITYTPQTPEDDRIITFSGLDNDGFGLHPFTSTIDAQGEWDFPARVTDYTLAKQVVGRTKPFEFTVFDPNGISKVRLFVAGDVFSLSYPLPKDVRAEFAVHLPVGAHSYRLEIEDAFGSTTTAEGMTLVVGRIRLDLLTRDFETKEPVVGDLLHLSNLEPDIEYDTTLTSTGRFQAEIPAGRYSILLEPGPDKGPLARILVTREHLHDSNHQFVPSGMLLDRDGITTTETDYSYLVFGHDQIPASLDMHSAFTGIAEVVSDREFVDRMITQTRDYGTDIFPDFSLIHFDVKRPVRFVVYTGTENGPCQGPIASSEALESHRRFFEHNLAIVNSAIVGGNPYSHLERIVVTSRTVVEIAPCSGSVRDAARNAPENVSFFWFDTDEEEDWDYWGSGFQDLGKHVTFINGTTTRSTSDLLGSAAHLERDAWALGPTTVGSVPNRSVRDSDESGTSNGFPHVPRDVVQYEFDNRFVAIATAFGPWAQYQLNPISGDRGKNVRLAPQQY